MPDVSPLDHHPDETNRHCPHCGDLSINPTRCPGWLAHRTRIVYRGEGWENNEWTMVVSAQKTLADGEIQLAHKRARFPDMLARLMAEVTVYVPVAEPAGRDESFRQHLDGSVPTTPLLARGLGRERDRALAAETLLRKVLALQDVTHKYRGQGGHDQLGANLACSGCQIAEQIRTHLEGTT